MKLQTKIFILSLLAAVVCATSGVFYPVWAQSKKDRANQEKPDKAKGGIQGKVRNENGNALGDVTIVVQREGIEVKQFKTAKNGEFEFVNLEPGYYDLVFTRPGMSTGSLLGIKVSAGEMIRLRDRLVMRPDEGELAFVRGAVFTAAGRSARGVRVTLVRADGNGALKKIEERYTAEDGSFEFSRLPAANATYYVVAKVEGEESKSPAVNINGAAIYRTAITLPARNPDGNE